MKDCVLNEFVCLVGIPGSGKSTWAKNKVAEDPSYVWLSSDNIRQEHPTWDNGQVFEYMKKMSIKLICEGKSVIYDATNLNFKLRHALRKTLDKAYHKGALFGTRCILFATPEYICRERNSMREGNARVPENVITKYLKCFTPPMSFEGWGRIEIEYAHNKKNEWADLFRNENGILDTFDQENPHHELSLGEHMNETARIASHLSSLYAETDSQIHTPEIFLAALYHDIGKVATKTFINCKGEKTEEAHYYGHEGYGAYMYVIHMLKNWEYAANSIPSGPNTTTIVDKEIVDHILIPAFYISQHMRPYIAWETSDKAKDRDSKIIPEWDMKALEILHEADVQAHKLGGPERDL